MVRYIAIDVHREFAQLAVIDEGLLRDEGRHTNPRISRSPSMPAFNRSPTYTGRFATCESRTLTAMQSISTIA